MNLICFFFCWCFNCDIRSSNRHFKCIFFLFILAFCCNTKRCILWTCYFWKIYICCSCTALARFQMNWNRFCDLASIFQSDFNIHIFHCNIFCICHKISNCCQSIHYVCFINWRTVHFQLFLLFFFYVHQFIAVTFCIKYIGYNRPFSLFIQKRWKITPHFIFFFSQNNRSGITIFCLHGRHHFSCICVLIIYAPDIAFFFSVSAISHLAAKRIFPCIISFQFLFNDIILIQFSI